MLPEDTVSQLSEAFQAKAKFLGGKVLAGSDRPASPSAAGAGTSGATRTSTSVGRSSVAVVDDIFGGDGDLFGGGGGGGGDDFGDDLDDGSGNDDGGSTRDGDGGSGGAGNNAFDVQITPPAGATLGEEWKEKMERYGYLEMLQVEGLAGQLENSKIRSVAWMLYLDVIPKEKTEWAGALAKSRANYDVRCAACGINAEHKVVCCLALCAVAARVLLS